MGHSSLNFVFHGIWKKNSIKKTTNLSAICHISTQMVCDEVFVESIWKEMKQLFSVRLEHRKKGRKKK